MPRVRRPIRITPVSAQVAFEPVSINGTDYPNSVLLPRNNTFDGYVSYDLKRKCRSFVGTAGVPDDNPITGKALMNISHDGQIVVSQTLVGGSAYKISQDVTDILELRIDRDYTADRYNDLAIGNAKVLCRF